MWANLQEYADLVTFTEEILNGKLHFLCSVCVSSKCYPNVLNNCHVIKKYGITYSCNYPAQKMKFPIKDFLSKCDRILSFLRIWSYLLKKSLTENFIFCAVLNHNELSRYICYSVCFRNFSKIWVECHFSLLLWKLYLTER